MSYNPDQPRATGGTWTSGGAQKEHDRAAGHKVAADKKAAAADKAAIRKKMADAKRSVADKKRKAAHERAVKRHEAAAKKHAEVLARKAAKHHQPASHKAKPAAQGERHQDGPYQRKTEAQVRASSRASYYRAPK